MRTFSEPPNFTPVTHPLHTILPSVVTFNPSSFVGNPLTTYLNIPQSSSSNAGNSFGPTTASDVTSIGTCVTCANQKLLARPIPSAFLLPTSKISLGSAPYGHVRGAVADRSSLAGSSATPPVPPSILGSVPRSTGPSRTIDPNLNVPLSHAGPPRYEVLAFLTAPGQAEKTFGGMTTKITLPDVPMYNSLFFQWLHARRAWMINQGCSDSVLVGPSFLAQIFDRWLQQWWPLFDILCIGTPETNPSGWVGIFDFWFFTLSTEHTLSPSSHQTTPAGASDEPTDVYQAPELSITGPTSAPLASRNKKNYRNEISTLTVQQIQDASTVAGGDADAVQRLAVVFPPGGVITRDALKVGRKPRVDHRGYQEFSGQANGRWYCQLCKRTGARTWKNEKDILNHVWNEHCDLPALG